MEYVTSSGLVVEDRRHSRSHTSNGNAPIGSVGPDVAVPGSVMYPSSVTVAPWDGWPVDWNPPHWGDAWSGYGYGRQMTGRVCTAMTCADLNSRQLASFPTYGVRANAETFTLPDWSINPEPGLYSGWSDAMHQVVNSLELRGESFQFVTGRFADGRIARFININPDSVGVEWIDGRIEYLIDGDPVDPADLCHIKYQAWSGQLRGVGPIQWAATPMETSAALESYASKLATRGGIPWAVLKAQVNLDDTQATAVQDRWVAAAARRDGAPAVIGNAFDLAPVSLTPKDMALLELREFDERRITAAFGVPGPLVNVSMGDSLTYANVTSLFLHHWQATLRPLAQLIAEAWSSWLLPRGSRVEFNPDRYVQPPLAERVAAYAAMYNMIDPATGERAMTLQEIRAAERLSPGEQPPGDTSGAQFMTGARV